MSAPKAGRWLILLSFSLTALAVPQSGDYAAMQVSSWSEDALASYLADFNQVLCAVNSANPHENVDRGAYLSRVNYSTCRPGSLPSADDAWVDITTNAKRVAGSPGEYVAQYWFDYSNLGKVYAEYIVKQGKSASRINGVYTLNLCVVWNQQSDCGVKYQMTSDGNTIEVHASQQSPTGPLGSLSHLIANVDSGQGYGILKANYTIQTQNSSTQVSALELKFSYKDIDIVIDYVQDATGPNSSNLTPNRNPGKECSSRKETDGDITVYDYRLFRSDGSEVKLSYPQLPYRVITDNNEYLMTGNDIVGGRLMPGNVAYDNGMGNAQDVTTAVQWLQSNPGRKLYAEPWLAGGYERLYELALTPDQSSVYVKNELGQPYVASAGVNLSFTPILNQNIQGLDASAYPNINNTTQTLIFMGNGYLNQIPWNQRDAYTILDGTAMSGVGADAGNTYFVRPKFFSVKPGTRACDPAAEALLVSAEAFRSSIPTNSSYASIGSLRTPWIDPRPRIGNQPNISGLTLKYKNGKPVN